MSSCYTYFALHWLTANSKICRDYSTDFRVKRGKFPLLFYRYEVYITGIGVYGNSGLCREV